VLARDAQYRNEVSLLDRAEMRCSKKRFNLALEQKWTRVLFVFTELIQLTISETEYRFATLTAVTADT